MPIQAEGGQGPALTCRGCHGRVTDSEGPEPGHRRASNLLGAREEILDATAEVAGDPLSVEEGDGAVPTANSVADVRLGHPDRPTNRPLRDARERDRQPDAIRARRHRCRAETHELVLGEHGGDGETSPVTQGRHTGVFHCTRITVLAERRRTEGTAAES